MSLMETRPRLLRSLILIAGLAIFACNKASERPQGHVVIGVQPNEGKKDLAPFASELARRTGLKVEIRVPTDYADLVEKFKKKDVDFAFFTSLTFLAAEREAGAKALLKKVYGSSEFYYSALIALKDSGLRTIEGLRGKTIGFVDPKSTSGYLYPRVMLRSAGLDAGLGVAEGPNTLKHLFCNTHKDCVRALADKKVDVVAVWADEPQNGTARGAWTDEEFGGLAARIRILKISDPIPNDAFAVRPEFYEKHPMIVFKVMEGLIGMGEDPRGSLKMAFDTDKMATATSRHYDSVRALEELVKERDRK